MLIGDEENETHFGIDEDDQSPKDPCPECKEEMSGLWCSNCGYPH